MRLHRTCIFLFMNIVLAKVAREPYCPPCPSCEERLLERVIRNELAMENLQKETGIKLNNAIKTAMENISNAVSEMTQKATMTGLQLKKENEILKGMF
ncbi:hypothetical protein DPMN_138165 [Dreissena polymorpha]|uniref:Uncharacterized protein n=1 Tax=Dreissena polymorpha TaxID=45954 RepID=A0A9D4G6M0_DREPO|nr:hypothetical protein DPMN_138165 [Dreissena polymorpha]